MTVRLLLATLALVAALTSAPAAAQDSRLVYGDPYGYFSTDAQYEAWYALRAGLEANFEDICGDSFCEGDYGNITPLRFECSVQQYTGRIGQCAWSFAASAEAIDPATGALAVEVPAWTCLVPLPPRTRIDALLAALAGDSPLYAALPGAGGSIYDALVDCL